MQLPSGVVTALNILNENGYQAYVVGGCVRDDIMGIAPHDFDICTDCRPDSLEDIFSRYRVFKTGISHGTCTVIIDDLPIEITTFRSEADYSDHRRPDGVEFISSHREDMARRDFTMNSISYNPNVGYMDYFGGKEDISNKIIRCVGDPEKRFEEDALRIMRAIRFSSVLGFEIEENTKKALFNKKQLLDYVSAERKSDELNKLLLGKNVFHCLMEYRDILAQIIPELIPCFDMEQKNKHHRYDVYEHIAHAVEHSPADKATRLCMLFHDIGKPPCMVEDKKGFRHFKGHQLKSAEIARNIMNRLRYDNKTKENVIAQIIEHDNRFECNAYEIKKFLSKYGYDFFNRHIIVRRADTLAQSEYQLEDKLDDLSEREELARKIVESGECYSLAQLAVNGRDLIDCGITDGKEIAATLSQLLDAVMKGECHNTKESLISIIKERA